MSDSPSFSTLTLPPSLDAEDVLGFRDQFQARLTALLRPKGRKREGAEVVLPEGIEHIDSLPDQVDRPWKRFDTACTALQSFRAQRASALADEAHAASDETEQNAANADADDRWRAFERWNSGAAGLADDGNTPSPVEARWLYAQLFPAPEGLRFITRRPHTQWTAMVQRMSVLDSDRAKAVMGGFGGARHQKQLAASHARFGRAFGFTIAVIEPVGGPTDGRPQWVTAREALRTLVQKLENDADPEIEGSEARATFLLVPYVELVNDLEKSRRARAKKADTAPLPTAPEQ